MVMVNLPDNSAAFRSATFSRVIHPGHSQIQVALPSVFLFDFRRYNRWLFPAGHLLPRIVKLYQL